MYWKHQHIYGKIQSQPTPDQTDSIPNTDGLADRRGMTTADQKYRLPALISSILFRALYRIQLKTWDAQNQEKNDLSSDFRLRNRDRKLAMNKIPMYLLEGFSGGPVVKTVHSQCRGHGFDHWLRYWDPSCLDQKLSIYWKTQITYMCRWRIWA